MESRVARRIGAYHQSSLLLALRTLAVLLCKTLVTIAELELTSVDEGMNNIVRLAVHRITRANEECCALAHFE